MRPVASLLAGLLAVLAAPLAEADEPDAPAPPAPDGSEAAPPAPPPPPPVVEAPAPPVIVATEPHTQSWPGISAEGCPTCSPDYWANTRARPFVALRLDAGYLYLKPRFSFGYGKPFALWGGLDVVPFVTPDSAGGYSGLRLQLGWFEARVGGRVVHAFSRQYLTPRASYNIVDLAEDTKRPADYVSLEAEISAAIPAGPGDILVLGTASSIQFVPAGSYVYDETLRVVVSPPPVYRGRLGYSLNLGRDNIGHVGLVGEVIEIPDRDAQVVRAGLVGSLDISDHLSVIGTVLVPVYGPDSLGLLGADYTELGFRYRWASGHEHPLPPRIPGETGETALAR